MNDVIYGIPIIMDMYFIYLLSYYTLINTDKYWIYFIFFGHFIMYSTLFLIDYKVRLLCIVDYFLYISVITGIFLHSKQLILLCLLTLIITLLLFKYNKVCVLTNAPWSKSVRILWLISFLIYLIKLISDD